MAAIIETTKCQDVTPLFQHEPFGAIALWPQILEAHQQLHSHQPYWEFTQSTTEKSPFYHTYQRPKHPHYQAHCGRLSDFSTPLIATAIDATIKSYAAGHLFGSFPWNSSQERNRLISQLISGFDTDRLVVMLTDPEQTKVLMSTMISPGKSNTPFSHLIGSSKASLPTLWSLNFTPNGHQAYYSAREREAVCYTRFSRLPDHLLANPGKSVLKAMSMEVLSAMAILAHQDSQARETSLQVATLDANDPEVIHTLLKHYGAHIIDAQPAATPQVLETPLAHHYRLPGITVLGFDFNTQLSIAQQIDQQLGQKVPVSRK
jgi:hypothetical protein